MIKKTVKSVKYAVGFVSRKGGGQVLGMGQKGGSGRRRKGGKGNVAHIS